MDKGKQALGKDSVELDHADVPHLDLLCVENNEFIGSPISFLVCCPYHRTDRDCHIFVNGDILGRVR